MSARTPDFWLAWMPLVVKLVAVGGLVYEIGFRQVERPVLLGLLGAILLGGEVGSLIVKKGGRNGNGQDHPS